MLVLLVRTTACAWCPAKEPAASSTLTDPLSAGPCWRSGRPWTGRAGCCALAAAHTKYGVEIRGPRARLEHSPAGPGGADPPPWRHNHRPPHTAQSTAAPHESRARYSTGGPGGPSRRADAPPRLHNHGGAADRRAANDDGAQPPDVGGSNRTAAQAALRGGVRAPGHDAGRPAGALLRASR